MNSGGASTPAAQSRLPPGMGAIQRLTSSLIKKPVNRRDVGYTQQRLQSITEVDKIASFLLASNYSYRSSPTPQTQGLIHNDCVAVIQVKGSLWMAANSQMLDPEDADNLNGELQFGELEYEIVVRGTKNQMHAEMQLVEELLANKINPQGLQMGVSKPCCKKCHYILGHLKIIHTAFHDDNVINWEAPAGIQGL
jgi:hypothetical protein